MPENLKDASLASTALQQICADDHLYVCAEAGHWGLTREAFADALCRSAAKRFGETSPSVADAASYLQSLHLKDLALACGCSQGNPQAWEYFFQNYREVLYAAARAIVGRSSLNETQARDLADSLYGELYGGNLRADSGAGQTRHSLFLYFHGRSKLGTWMRAILAQRHVNAFRASRRTESLSETENDAVESGDGAALARIAASRFVPPDPDKLRVMPLMQEVVVVAISSLAARDRLRLALYYVQDLTLAQIGRILGEHEATASRHLECTRKDVRGRVEELLRAKRLSQAEIRLCFDAAQEEWPFDLTKALETEAGPSSLAAGDSRPRAGVSKKAVNSAIRRKR